MHSAYKPDSVLPEEMDDHLSCSGSCRPESLLPTRSPVETTKDCLLEIAPGRVYRSRILSDPEVGSYPTVSPLPTGEISERRYTFCCTFHLLLEEISFFQKNSGSYPVPCFLVSGLSSPSSFPKSDAVIRRNAVSILKNPLYETRKKRKESCWNQRFLARPLHISIQNTGFGVTI